MRHTYTDRVAYTTNPIAKRLLMLMDEKETNLAIAADAATKAELLSIAEALGPEICILKTHIDTVEDFDTDLLVQLEQLSETYRFLLFEDRKFADIGNTVIHQYGSGIYRIADWAHITNAHTVPGPGIIEGLKQVGLPKGRGLLLLAEMSSAGALTEGAYTDATLAMAEAHKDFVIGFIAMKRLLNDPAFITMTPGVKRSSGGDALGQQYRTPEEVIYENESDIIIVGRGIYEAPDPVAEARRYRDAGWRAYTTRLQKTSSI